MTENKFAQESEKTKKAREKIKQRWQELEKKITPDLLKKKNIEIHDRIARHAQHRVILKKKNISLFDENKNAADLSKKVTIFSKKLKEDYQILQSSLTSLDQSMKKRNIVSNQD